MNTRERSNDFTFKLCYVDKPWAFFTTQDIKKQWGDDWNDAPYEHNAGEPYEALKERGEDWKIIRIAFEGPLYTPDHNVSNSQWSVAEINHGNIAWLRTDKWFENEPINIFAGEDLKTFIAKICLSGGKVYFEWEVVSNITETSQGQAKRI